MNRDLVIVFFSAAVATFNPSLLAAVTVMLLLPHPKRLMLGYLLGAYTASIAAGLAIVFSLHGSSAVATSGHTASPGEELGIGAIALAIAFVVATGRDAPMRKWHKRRKEAKARDRQARQPWQARMLGRGSVGVTFAVGATLSFPGVSYLNALHHIVRLNPQTVPICLLVVYFCVMQQILLEVPLLAYVVAPERTQVAVSAFRAWLAREGRRLAVIGICAIGVFLVVRGLTVLS
jgi:Sap, sulfolipid-1-addressing protein